MKKTVRGGINFSRQDAKSPRRKAFDFSSHGFFASWRLGVNSDAADAAPDGAGKLFGAGCCKDAAPTALGQRRDAENDTPAAGAPRNVTTRNVAARRQTAANCSRIFNWRRSAETPLRPSRRGRRRRHSAAPRNGAGAWLKGWKASVQIRNEKSQRDLIIQPGVGRRSRPTLGGRADVKLP